jgi:hypothetical protein
VYKMKPMWLAMIAAMMLSGASAFAQNAAPQSSSAKPLPDRAAKKSATPNPEVDASSGVPFPAKELFNLVGKRVQDAPGPSGTVSADEWASLYGSYWFYEGKAGKATLKIARFEDTGHAFGLFCLLTSKSARPLPNVKTGWLEDGRALLWVKQEVVIVEGKTPGADMAEVERIVRDASEKLEKWHAGLPNLDPTIEDLPVAVRKLPEAQKVPTTVGFAVNESGLKRGVLPNQANANGKPEFPATPGAEFAWADYGDASPFGRILIGDYPTPQDATAAFDEVKKYVEGLPELDRQSRRVYRQGNFIIEAFGVRDEKAVAAVVKKIEYDYVVRWLGDRPDRSAADNRLTVQQAGQVVVGTFRLVTYAVIGMACLGLVVGTLYFRWRRKQAGEGFVEADAMLRLNLNEDYSLSPSSAVKRLPSGD